MCIKTKAGPEGGEKKLVYRIIRASGLDHRRVFQAEVSWQNRVLATGMAKSKKDAETRAASEALRSRLWAT